MTPPRRILLLITDLELGGTPTVVRELALRLNHPPDVVIEVACLSSWGPVADELKRAGITVHALAAQSIRDLGVIFRFIALARRRGYDTVLSFLVHANTIAAIGRPILGYRLIQSIQTTQPRPRWHWWLGRMLHPFAQRVLVPSTSAARAAQERSEIPSDKIVIIPNAVDSRAFARSPIPQQNPQPYPIAFLGRLDPVKRIPHLLRALLDVRSNIHLHIHGEGPARADIAAAIETYGIKRLVTMHGATPRPHEVLAQAGLLVLPSLAEGFGLVLIEAMAAGVPVIATNVPGIRDVVRHDQTGLLVDPKDPLALASAIDRVINDAALRQRLIENGLEEVKRRFTWYKVLDRYRALLEIDDAGEVLRKT